jgi:nucleoid DNA-binding protein
VLLAVAGLLWTGAAEAMNKAELIDAIAKEAKISWADAGRALDGFIQATARALKKGDRISLVGFGSFSVSKRAAGADGCGTEAEIEFVAGASFRHGENPLYEEGGGYGENPLYVESSSSQDDGTIAVFGWTQGAFQAGDEIVVLEEVLRDGIIHRDIAARGIVGGVIVLTADGREAVVDFGEGDEVAGLLLRGIEKSDIRRGMVIAKPGAVGDCPEDGAIVRDEEFVARMVKEAQLTAHVVVAAYNAILDIIPAVVNSGEEVDIEGFGTFHEEEELHVSAHEAAHVVQQRTGRNPQTGKEIKIAARGLSDSEMDRLTAMVTAALRQGGKEIKIAAKKVAKFKAGKALAETVK